MEEELVDRLRKRDEDAFAVLVERYHMRWFGWP